MSIWFNREWNSIHISSQTGYRMKEKKKKINNIADRYCKQSPEELLVRSFFHEIWWQCAQLPGLFTAKTSLYKQDTSSFTNYTSIDGLTRGKVSRGGITGAEGDEEAEIFPLDSNLINSSTKNNTDMTFRSLNRYLSLLKVYICTHRHSNLTKDIEIMTIFSKVQRYEYTLLMYDRRSTYIHQVCPRRFFST